MNPYTRTKTDEKKKSSQSRGRIESHCSVDVPMLMTIDTKLTVGGIVVLAM